MPDSTDPTPAADRPTVSVIVPAYNAAPYLDTSLASVAAQRRAPDEVVVIDDASTDDTLAIAKRWAAVLPLVVVERLENRGLGAARRLGIERSSGELIALLDADDYWMPDHLETMLAAHAAHGGLVTPNHYRWVPGERLGNVPATEVQPVPPPDEQPLAILEANFLSYGCVFRRSDYDAVGGFSEMRSSEDWELWIRMIRQGGCRVVRPEHVTLMYRKRPDSLSATDGCLEFNVAILEQVLASAAPEERPLVERNLRHHRARLLFVEGLQAAQAGDVATARRRWLRAAATDRSLRWGPGIKGSTSLRALACVAAPSLGVRLRKERVADVEMLTKY